MKDKRLFRPLIWITLAVSVVLLAFALFSPDARMPALTQGTPLHILGEYARQGSAERFPFDSQTDLSAQASGQVTVYGHFDREVKPNTQIVMRIANLQVQLLVNGRQVFSFGDRHPSFVRSAGNVWTAFTSDGVLPTDDVELRLTSVYAGGTLSSFSAFFDGLSTGSEYPVYQAVLSSQSYHLIIGVLILLIGIGMLGMSQYARALKLASADPSVNLSAFVVCSGLWTFINYDYISLIIPYPAFNQLLEMVCMVLAPVFLMRYMLSLLPKSERKLGYPVLYATLALALGGLILQLTGLCDLVALTVVYIIGDLVAIVFFSVCMIRCLRNPRLPEARASLPPLFILFAGALLNILNFLLDWHTGGLFYSTAFLLFACLELGYLVRTLGESVRRNREYARMENELTQSRIAVMLSQIKPHFLYNALNSISALCLTDPLMADQAITSLSNYLRGNIRSLEQSAPVPFEQELEHIKYYVRLEQLRYGEKLRVVYSIGTTDFLVPTLSLQTLVENAIRHGVSPKPEGGLVVVQTERGDGYSMVRIIDNGVGFDPDLRSQNADSIGLANAKKRMEVMMNATFEVQSIPGKGTTISIRIPDGNRKG